VFRPFVGEVLKGRIVSCNEEHIRGRLPHAGEGGRCSSNGWK
jgi:hypothetical protein